VSVPSTVPTLTRRLTVVIPLQTELEHQVANAQLPSSPRLFLIDGYALIYRAFFALISRPLTTSKGENTSAAWGVVTFLQRLIANHHPEYIGWVHDSGLSFRHETYPAYKATREKLTEELQADFNRGMERISEILAAFQIPVLTLKGYEADDVIGTLASQCSQASVNVVIVSGDKDFQQLVRPGVWLLNPGRGGPANVEEQWVGVENANERLGIPPGRVIDYLALVGDSSDNVPGVPGIGDKTARDLVMEFGPLESILASVDRITKKRPREALLEHAARARLSKELVTIRDNLPLTLDIEQLRVRPADTARLRQICVELEFTTLIKDIAPAPAPVDATQRAYTVVDSVQALERLVNRARKAKYIAVNTQTVPEPGATTKADPLRSRLVSITIALSETEVFYLPLAHREWQPTQPAQGDLLIDASRDRASADAPDDREVAQDDDGDTEGTSQGALNTPTRRPRGSSKKAAATQPTSAAARVLAEGVPPVTNLPAIESASMALLRQLLEDDRVRKTAQNAKRDLLVLRRVGVTLRGLDFDTMLASYVLDPGRRSHGLDVLALEFLDRTLTSYEELCGKGKTEIPFDACPIEAARDYACEEAEATFRLRAVFEPLLETHGLTNLLREIELPLLHVLADMEWVGVSIDLPWFASLKERFKRERERVEKEIYAEAGGDFNINSNNQLRTILFDKLQLPVRKRTATGPSTDASVLQELADAGHTLPELLMEYRELSKLESTYLDTLPSLIHPGDQRLHTSFNQTVASTGRLSSSDPNLQNIPIRRELGRDIRRGFIPRRGWLFLAADYSQIELRLLAHLSNDSAFVDAFNSGGDIHRQTASIIFGVPASDVTSEMRARAKTINFATIYGQGAHALSRQLKISNTEAREFIATYFERFRGVRRYLDSQVEHAREHGYVETIFHRRRYIPELRDRNFNIRAFGERTAANSPIQGSAADLIKIAMIHINAALRRSAMQSRMLLQVHDELVFELPPQEQDALVALVRHEMEHAAELSVPLVVDVGLGDSWLATKLA
jgi:DNA polymerase-1